MAKKKSKTRHQSFKLSSSHSTERVVFYIAATMAISILIGYFLKDQTMAVLGISTY